MRNMKILHNNNLWPLRTLLFTFGDIYVTYLSSEIEREAEKYTQRNTNNVVTSHVYVCHKCLPPTPNGHTLHITY